MQAIFRERFEWPKPLYILDKETKKVTTYLNFNGRNGQGGLFHKFRFENGQANGFINFLFDPDYARNGKFYTIHLEDPSLPGSIMPDNTNFPGLKLDGYTTTPAIVTPPSHLSEGVIIEWTDTNISNSTFEGTAREVLRLQLNTYSHPLGEITFNPAARPGDSDWRVMYVGCGDSRTGEERDPIVRLGPQRLDLLVGKVWRIIPDPNEHKDSSTLSDNGRYRIPNDNPFVKLEGARKEIWAYGLRNPNRLTWYIDPSDRKKATLIAHVVGLQTWETVDIIHKGANYGYSLREGNELLKPDNHTGPLPGDDHIPDADFRHQDQWDGSTDLSGNPIWSRPRRRRRHVNERVRLPGQSRCRCCAANTFWPTSPPAISELYGFQGLCWPPMMKSDPKTMAPLHPVKILWSAKGAGKELYNSMAPVTEAQPHHARGGKA